MTVTPLTKKAKVDAEKLRITQLTSSHEAYFKLIFSHQLAEKFNFHSLSTRKKTPVPPGEALEIFRAFGAFVDASVRLTITEVERRYRRNPDESEGTYDPETGEDVQIEHYCLYDDEDTPKVSSDSVRIHGYARSGYFVITKLDWHHDVNKMGTQVKKPRKRKRRNA